jgi:formylglycine-generating enzyme required for sulfatase activity
MGSNEDPSEKPIHRVTIKPFAISKFPITNREWKECVAAKACGYEPLGNDDAPVANVSWDDAREFVKWLSKVTQKEYRLPSEAEWEYAARGGTTTARWWGETIGAGNANCNGCGSKFDYRLLADVDSFAPNPFGLYGVLGNAWEWTQDCWHESYVGAPGDGSPWTVPFCNRHVIRGGSWDNLPVFIRSAARAGSIPNGGEYDYSSLSGLRIARTLP